MNRFFIVDNGSSDGTIDYLMDQSDVHVFSTEGHFKESNGGATWLNTLLAQFGVGSWCVTVDIDELLYYPGSEHAPLQVLTEYLDKHGYLHLDFRGQALVRLNTKQSRLPRGRQ